MEKEKFKMIGEEIVCLKCGGVVEEIDGEVYSVGEYGCICSGRKFKKGMGFPEKINFLRENGVRI